MFNSNRAVNTLLHEPDGRLSAYLQISIIWGEFEKKKKIDSVTSINVPKEAEEEEEDCVKDVKTNFNTVKPA